MRLHKVFFFFYFRFFIHFLTSRPRPRDNNNFVSTLRMIWNAFCLSFVPKVIASVIEIDLLLD